LPSSSNPSRKLIALLAFVVLLIIYGSLYPWQFEPLRDTNPVTVLLHSWNLKLNRFIIRDIGVNIVLYMPLGFVACLVFRRRGRVALPVFFCALLGFLLSCSVELAQAYEPDRYSSLVDVTTNVLGAIAGAVLAIFSWRFVAPLTSRAALRKPRDTSAIVLVGCFAASLLFPLFPISGRAALHAKIVAILHGPILNPIVLISAISSWYAAGLMMRAGGFGRSKAAAAALLLPLGAQLFIIHHEPWIATVFGAIIGAAFAVAFPPAPAFGAAAVLFMIVVRGLAPFRFASTPQSFLWVPFSGFLAMDWATGVALIFQKAFYYGAAIWLLRFAGVRIRNAAVATSFLLACLEAIQVFLPAHTAEITDPLLALLLGFGIAALNPSRGKEKRFRSPE
jgi:glycopeptide antibiotics resistance protein